MFSAASFSVLLFFKPFACSPSQSIKIRMTVPLIESTWGKAAIPGAGNASNVCNAGINQFVLTIFFASSASLVNLVEIAVARLTAKFMNASVCR